MEVHYCKLDQLLFQQKQRQREIAVNRESLLDIISHLRENFNLDESKSCIFIGESLEEFILEKYPGFRFKNGTVEAINEEETYVAASLLLFFVCVNSKDVDIKNAMCSKLSTGDQEVILKFSKSLMECSSISSSDVVAAIAEACGPDMANVEGACGSVMVAETPPLLRSLHNEVRRLQAALDAERFDRNYLQDELARTNLKLEKLLKDKQQYKLDIVNLKSKISMCCHQETEPRSSVTVPKESAKLRKQLELLEQRLVDVQEKLEEVQHVRDSFKVKLEELKGERDRLLALNLEETSRSSKLAEELEAEKRQSQSLRELVMELRQHNHRNVLDWSLLECDDLDTSVQSFQRSFSGCSEVCANVVEVQLSEERAKTVALKQQIQILQDKINEQIQETENFKVIISDKDNDIFNLKHRINEEIEEKNNLKNYFDYEVMKLNNLRNELEQQITENSAHSRSVIDKQMKEIQTLQEEKLSLIQNISCLTDEKLKLENVIKDLSTDIDVEKTSKMKMREDYETQLMKMKEKVLNRNNELVELQNNILQNSEVIEQLNLELRKEREAKDETINKYNTDMSVLNAQKIHIEGELQNKNLEISALLDQVKERDATIEDRYKDIEHLKMSITKIQEDCKILQDTKQNLLDDIQNRQTSAEKTRKELENLRNKHTEDKNKLHCQLDEMCAMIKSLQTQLQSEIDFKMGLQQELENTQGMATKLSNTNTKLSTELSEITIKMQEKDKLITEKELALQQQQQSNIKVQEEYDTLKIENNQLADEIIEKDKKIHEYEDKLQNLDISLEQEISKNQKIVDSLNKDLVNANKQNETLLGSIKSLNEENVKLVHQFNEKCNFISHLESERENLSQKMEEKGETINILEQKLNEKMLAFIQIENNFGIEISKLVTKLTETEKTLKEIKTKSNTIIENQESQLQKLNADIFILQGKVECGSKEKAKLEIEKENLAQQLKDLTNNNNKIEKDYENNCKELQQIINTLKDEMNVKDKEISDLKIKNNLLSSTVEEKAKELSVLQDQNYDWKTKNDTLDKLYRKENEKLQRKTEELIHNNESLKIESKENLKTISNLEEKLNTYERKIVTLEKEKEVYETLMTGLETERNDLLNKKTNLESERDKLIAKKSELESNFESLKNELTEVKMEFVNLQEEKLKLLNIIEINKSEITKYERNIERDYEEKEKVYQAFELEKSKLSNECTLLQNNLTRALKDLDIQNMELSRLQEKLSINNNIINNLEKATTEKDEILAVKEKEIKYLKSEKDNLTLENKNLLKQNYGIEEELKHLQTVELPKLREENLHLIRIVEENKNVVLNFEQLLNDKQEQNEKLCEDLESEKNNLTEKCTFLQENLTKAEQTLENQNLQMNKLKEEIEDLSSKAKEKEEDYERNNEILSEINKEKDIKLGQLTQELQEERKKIFDYEKVIKSKDVTISELKKRLDEIENEKKDFDIVRKENEQFMETIRRKEEECAALKIENDEWKIKKDMLEVDFESEKKALQNELDVQIENNKKLEIDVKLHSQNSEKLEEHIKIYDKTISELQDNTNMQDTLLKNLEKEKIALNNEKGVLEKEISVLNEDKNNLVDKINELQTEVDILRKEELTKLNEENLHLRNVVEKNESVITMLNKQLEDNKILHKDIDMEKLELSQKCDTLLTRIEHGKTEVNALKEEIKLVTSDAKGQIGNLKLKNEKLTKIIEEKDAIIITINEELSKEKLLKEKYEKQIELQDKDIYELNQKLEELKKACEMVDIIKNENKELLKQIQKNELNSPPYQEKSPDQQSCSEVQNSQCDILPQVDKISSSCISHSSMGSNKTIIDLERILNDKNRTITTLQSDITFLKSLIAESENKVLDVSKELEISREHCQQLSNQLKKIVYQKNEEIMDLKKQVTKMSAAENRASQIIKVSAKYQEIIHKRIAEIKSNTVLKELTNFGNTNNCDSDLKRSLNAGAITMEDLENFLETTDRHLRRCSEKRMALQKERDRLLEVNRINESEIINVRKFLTELSVSVKTFNTVREVYTQKLSKIVSLQRTVRREVLSKDGCLTDVAMCKLERGYAAVMQDLAECSMNVERWVERTISRVVSTEKIKQAFTSNNERVPLAPASFQNAGIEVQMVELENNFQKLLEEVARAQKGDGARDVQSVTLKEVQAEYEDKLTRMKAKMKDLYYEQIEIFKNKQKEEIQMLEQELQRTRDKLQESSKTYEEHISALSIELWKLGEKFLDKKDEAEWLRRKQRSESLMSLQHVPSTGIDTLPEENAASDTLSLRSLPVNINKKPEGRALHMSDEEGEVFDNRHVRALRSPPRLSELRRRNSLCPPHLRSCYPVETQFARALHEDEIKAGPANPSIGGRPQRKEVGITAYKKPGPPTPSKQAGRLSATDSELRESLRVEAEPQASRKTTTPSRLRSFFGTARNNDTAEGTPRSKRLSNFFRKK